MFDKLINRFGSNLGLSEKEAIRSDLVKKLCSDLIHGHMVVINSNQKKSFTVNTSTNNTKRDSV
jgi:hypothetical protein